MDALSFRLRVAVLWVASAITISYSVLIFLLAPGALEEAMAGTMEGQVLDDAGGLLLSIMVGVPVVLAAATVLLADRLNHLVNLVAGLLCGLLMVYGMAGDLLAGEFNGHVLLVALGAGLAFLIAALSLVGLRQPASQPRT